MRACRETAKSTRSCVPPPSRTSCAPRTARSFHHAARASSAETPAPAAAPIAIHSAVVACTRYPSEKMTLYSAELFDVVRSPGTGWMSTLTVVGTPNGGADGRLANVTFLV